MRQRSEIPSIYQTFTAMIHTQFNAKIRLFVLIVLVVYLHYNEIYPTFSWHSLSAVLPIHSWTEYGSQAKAPSHTWDCSRSSSTSSVPRIFWAEVVLTSVNLIITPSSVLAGKTPHERLYSSSPDYNMLRTFGCTYYVLLPPIERTKLSAWSAKCIFLGISSEHKGYATMIPWHVVFLYPVMSLHWGLSLFLSFISGYTLFVATRYTIYWVL